MKPAQEKYLRMVLKLCLGFAVLMFIINHVVGVLITIGIIIVVAILVVRFSPYLLEFIDDIKDFFSK